MHSYVAAALQQYIIYDIRAKRIEYRLVFTFIPVPIRDTRA